MREQPEKQSVTRGSSSLLSGIPCDVMCLLLRTYAAKNLGYHVTVEEYMSPWGTIFRDTHSIHVKHGLAPAEVILVLSHEIGHVCIPISWGYTLQEAGCEMFADVVTTRLGFDFHDRCVLMATRFLMDCGSLMSTEERIAMIKDSICNPAHALLLWVEEEAKKERLSDVPKFYNVHHCPDWQSRDTLLDSGSIHSASRGVPHAHHRFGRCDPSNCSKYPRDGGIDTTGSDHISLPWG